VAGACGPVRDGPEVVVMSDPDVALVRPFVLAALTEVPAGCGVRRRDSQRDVVPSVTDPGGAARTPGPVPVAVSVSAGRGWGFRPNAGAGR